MVNHRIPQYLPPRHRPRLPNHPLPGDKQINLLDFLQRWQVTLKANLPSGQGSGLCK